MYLAPHQARRRITGAFSAAAAAVRGRGVENLWTFRANPVDNLTGEKNLARDHPWNAPAAPVEGAFAIPFA